MALATLQNRLLQAEKCLARGQFVHHNERTIAMSFSARTSLALALPLLAFLPSLLSASCAPKACALNDADCDQVPDDIGAPSRGTAGEWLKVDTNKDGMLDSYGIDEDGNGTIDGVGLDLNADGFYDAIDRPDAQGTYDGVADKITGSPAEGSGGAPGSGGASPGSGGAPPTTGSCLTATPSHSPGGTATGQYQQVDTWRANCADFNTCPAVQYKFLANGWGTNWQSHSITYAGTQLSIDSYLGSEGIDFSPAGYPAVFCGLYSDIQSGECGLPATIASLSRLDSGMRWSAGSAGTDYNVSYDIWIGNGTTQTAFLMLWLHDPASDQPVGSATASNVMVGSDPARWTVWTGTHQGMRIVSYVRPPGEDSMSYSFDVLEYVRHAQQNYALPGDTIMSVAGGFEIWNGPVTGLKIEDFCVDAHPL